MAISTEFNTRIQAVDATKSITFVSGTGGAASYGKYEWSYSGSGSVYTVLGGSDIACEHGAADLLEKLGFRFYAPTSLFWKVPVSIDMSKTASQQDFFMPDSRVWPSYGYGSRNPANSDTIRWMTLNGVNAEYYKAGHRWASIAADASIEASGFWTSHPNVRYDMNYNATPDASAAAPAGTTDSGTNPVLSSLLVTPSTTYGRGSQARAFTVTTSTNNGTIYVVASTSATVPTSAQIRAGQNHLGATVPSRTITVTNSGTWTLYSVSSLTPGTTYYLHVIHRDSSNRDSNILTSSAFATSARAYSFDLQEAIDQGYYTDLVQLCAAWLLGAGGSITNTYEFDPSDSDPQDSDLVFPFTKAVADAVRAGTSAIGPYSAKSPNSSAQLGIYAYAGHREVPTASVSPGVYTQVALGFNNTGLTYAELIEQHAAKADAIKLREYWDPPIWSKGQPLSNGRTKNNYFDVYDDYIAAATASGKRLIGASCEFSGNWLANLVLARWGLQKLHYNTGSYATCLAEIVADIFDSDPAVTQLYEYWSNPYKRWHRFSLLDSMEIIDTMVDGWYKTYFKQYMVILYELIYLPAQLEQSDPNWNTEADLFPPAFSTMMSHVWAMEADQITHSWAWLRIQANGAVASTYPALRYNASPSYYTSPVAPDDDDYAAAYAQLVLDNTRDPDLESTDLVLVQDITPQVSATADANAYYCYYLASYIFVGPGTVTITENDREFEDEDGGTVTVPGEIITTTYGEGFHVVEVGTTSTATWTGGILFLTAFPLAAKQPDGGNSHWVYVQQSAAGAVEIETSVRAQFEDADGLVTVYYPEHASYVDPANLGPGQVKMVNVNTSNVNLITVNPYVSPKATVALMPREVAEADFAVRTKIRRG